MKQEMISFIEKHKEDFKDLNKFLYDNPEKSYNEYNSYNYICNLLNKHNFKVEENFLDLKTSFRASKGYGSPNICFLCEYDAYIFGFLLSDITGLFSDGQTDEHLSQSTQSKVSTDG